MEITELLVILVSGLLLIFLIWFIRFDHKTLTCNSYCSEEQTKKEFWHCKERCMNEGIKLPENNDTK